MVNLLSAIQASSGSSRHHLKPALCCFIVLFNLFLTAGPHFAWSSLYLTIENTGHRTGQASFLLCVPDHAYVK
ncbi:hypothetical protein Q7C36_023155 [Tachysurus vachellii]|uniref:Uncharacterized protein n=1 Tax=Tachysurus vachellii TaxID=175792 RepID=A0AA88LJI2_TACVA|nr:hypothetical protein Q7C36_023155 [Tachysurus vachellii]